MHLNQDTETTPTSHSDASTSNGLSAPGSTPKKKPSKPGGRSRPKKAKAAPRKKPASKKKHLKAKGKAKARAGHTKQTKTYALVARLGIPTYNRAWTKVRKLVKAGKTKSMSSWLTEIIEKASK